MEFFWSFPVLLFGSCIGSFANVLIDRLPKGQTILWGRSHCDRCKKTLRWFELIPIVSYVSQGGRCLRCKRQLSLQYPLIEMVTGMVAFYLFFHYQTSLPLGIGYFIFAVSLLVIFVSDSKYKIIPDAMVITAAIGAAIIIFFEERFATPVPTLLSGLGSFTVFILIWSITKGRGMGFGDVKLSPILGFALGFPRIVVALYLAFLTGAMVGVILVLRERKSLKAQIPFGPFLVLGTYISIVWGQQLFDQWMRYLQ